MGSEKFKNFLTVSFSIDMLAPVFGDKSCDTLFNGWQGKNMGDWFKFINDNNIVLEFYSNNYIIKGINNHQMPLPKDINDFINDMHRFDIPLYWSKWIDANFEPREYLDSEGISNYFTDLLTKMGKSNEI